MVPPQGALSLSQSVFQRLVQITSRFQIERYSQPPFLPLAAKMVGLRKFVMEIIENTLYLIIQIRWLQKGTSDGNLKTTHLLRNSHGNRGKTIR